jgi:hypothetical protein
LGGCDSDEQGFDLEELLESVLAVLASEARLLATERSASDKTPRVDA